MHRVVGGRPSAMKASGRWMSYCLCRDPSVPKLASVASTLVTASTKVSVEAFGTGRARGRSVGSTVGGASSCNDPNRAGWCTLSAIIRGITRLSSSTAVSFLRFTILQYAGKRGNYHNAARTTPTSAPFFRSNRGVGNMSTSCRSW